MSVRFGPGYSPPPRRDASPSGRDVSSVLRPRVIRPSPSPSSPGAVDQQPFRGRRGANEDVASLKRLVDAAVVASSMEHNTILSQLPRVATDGSPIKRLGGIGGGAAAPASSTTTIAADGSSALSYHHSAAAAASSATSAAPTIAPKVGTRRLEAALAAGYREAAIAAAAAAAVVASQRAQDGRRDSPSFPAAADDGMVAGTATAHTRPAGHIDRVCEELFEVVATGIPDNTYPQQSSHDDDDDDDQASTRATLCDDDATNRSIDGNRVVAERAALTQVSRSALAEQRMGEFAPLHAAEDQRRDFQSREESSNPSAPEPIIFRVIQTNDSVDERAREVGVISATAPPLTALPVSRQQSPDFTNDEAALYTELSPRELAAAAANPTTVPTVAAAVDDAASPQSRSSESPQKVPAAGPAQQGLLGADLNAYERTPSTLSAADEEWHVPHIVGRPVGTELRRLNHGAASGFGTPTADSDRPLPHDELVRLAREHAAVDSSRPAPASPLFVRAGAAATWSPAPPRTNSPFTLHAPSSGSVAPIVDNSAAAVASTASAGAAATPVATGNGVDTPVGRDSPALRLHVVETGVEAPPSVAVSPAPLQPGSLLSRFRGKMRET